jgi:general secretion pathway protein D
MNYCSTLTIIYRHLQLLFLVGLCGCTAHHIRESSLDDFYSGNFEAAISKAHRGLEKFPGNAELTATLLRVQDESVTRLLASASEQRTLGNVDGARKTVKRAAQIAPRDERVVRAIARLDLDERARIALASAAELINAGDVHQADMALRPISLEDPQNPEMRSLRKRVDAMLYQEVVAAPALPDTRPVTLEFRDAPARQVFEALARETNVNFVLDKDIRADLRITVYAHRISLEKALDLIMGTNQLAKKMLDETTILVYANTPEKVKEYQELIVRSFFLSHVDAKEVAAALKSVLRLREPFVDERMNLLILREAPQQIDAAEKLIAVLDQGEPEVMVDIAVLEVNSNRLLDLGIQFPDAFSLMPLPPASATSLTVGNIAGLGRNRIGLGLGGATVNLQSQDGDATVLANPRIRAKNREKAHILIGDKYPVVSSSAAPTAGYVSENITYIDVGIKVDFEPLIGLDGDVTLKLNLEVSTIANKVTTTSGSIAYQIGTRSAGTTLRLQDGETQILGGLLSRNDSSSANRLPGLGDLPIAGRLFSSTSDSSDKTEVLLSITPHVIANLRRPEPGSGAFYSGTENTARLQFAGQRGLFPNSTERSAAKPSDSTVGKYTQERSHRREDLAGDIATAEMATQKPLIPEPVSQGLSILTSPSSSGRIGEDLAIAVSANIATALRALPITLSYDSSRLRFDDFVAGPLLGESRETSVTHSVNSVAGTISLAIVRNTDAALIGAGVLGTFHFTSLQHGETTVQISAVNPLGAVDPVATPTLPPPSKIVVQ